MKKWIKKSLLTLGIAGSLSFYAFDQVDYYFEISKNLEIYASLFKEINTYYVDEIEPAKLMRTGIDAMLKSLDPYTNYISESEMEDYRFMTTGQYGGVGAQISLRDKKVMIREPYEGWPAQKSGLRAGDVLMEIDGKSTDGKSTDDVSKMLKGQPGTQVKLLVKRIGSDQLIPITLTREEIKVKNVPYYGMVNKEIGYIKFAGFRQQAAHEVKEALLELKKNNPEMKGIILDLRGNPGGLLDEAIRSVNIFVDRGQLVVSTKGKLSEWNKEYNTDLPATDLTTPVVVLTDKGSASASEIVSGSLQDFDRAVVIGENTFGKGLVQTTRPLPYNTQLKVTTSKYYIPSGRCIQAIDYANKDSDGRGTKLPDSLKKSFKTKAGRIVYDGNGIKPDISIDRSEQSDILNTLLLKYIIFDYATQYRDKNAQIGDIKSFKLTEQDWKDFLAFVKGKEYDYSTHSEESLMELEKNAKNEKYFDAIKQELVLLKEKLKNDKKVDIEKHKVEIMELLEEEVASRYYYQSGRIISSFNDDKDIKEAVNILTSPAKYQKILTAEVSKK